MLAVLEYRPQACIGGQTRMQDQFPGVDHGHHEAIQRTNAVSQCERSENKFDRVHLMTPIRLDTIFD